MNLSGQLQSIPLSTIDVEDRTYCLTPWDEMPGDELIESIRRFGILHPPILYQRSEKPYLILTGRKRITAAKHLRPEAAILCRVIDPKINQTDALSLLFEETLLGKSFSIVAQAFFLEKLIKIAGQEKALPYLERMGHKPQERILAELLKIIRLGESALRALHEGSLHVKTAVKLLYFSETEQDLLVRLLADLHFGGSKQQKLVDFCTELTKRKDMPLKDILANSPIMKQSSQEDNIPQLGAALLSWLYNECFPRLASAEKEFKQKISSLQLPPTIHITHTPSFENDEITLSLRFPDWHALIRAIEDIKKISLQRQNGPS